jgi:carboxypeptidase Taq
MKIMNEKMNALLQKVYELHDLEKATGVLGWDKQVNMPKKGNLARTQQLSTLGRIRHTLFTSDEMGELIAAAAEEQAAAPYDGFEASLLRVLQYDYDQARKFPTEFVVQMTMVGGQANAAWEEARANSDFAHFLPHFEKVLGLTRQRAEYLEYDNEPYDALLNQFEREMETAVVRHIFQEAKEALIPLREAIEERLTAVDDSLLHQPFDVAKQQEFARYIAEAIGYDFSRGHLGTATHPFASSFSRDDARITSRWYPDFLNPSLFGVLHESGHAMYEQGTHPDFARTPLARGASLGFHESQSRMMENIVGRSLPFWRRHFPKLQETFPDALGGATADEFYRAINKVQPSFIRVEADEVNYNLHIILRFELEQAMLNGDLAAADVPAAWNDKMQELLGIVPPNDSEGCLQDIHWSWTGMGYFPTYALGNFYAAQLYEAAQAQNPQITADMAQGDPASLVAWMRENVHQHGRKYTPDELIHRATGQPLSHAPFVRYINDKFSQIYGL